MAKAGELDWSELHKSDNGKHIKDCKNCGTKMTTDNSKYIGEQKYPKELGLEDTHMYNCPTCETTVSVSQDKHEKLSKADYVHTPTALWSAVPGCGVDPLNKAKPVFKKGEVPRKPSNEEIANYILKGADAHGVGQWKDEDHLHKEIVSQEQAEQLQKDWENSLDNFYKAANAPVVPEDKQTKEWGSGTSFNDSLTEEERLKRNMYNDTDGN